MAGAEYEIHVCRGGRWGIETAASSEADAVAAAKKRIGMPGVEAVRVVKEASSRLGRVSQSVVFEQQGKTDTGVVTVGTIEAAPSKCEKAADLYRGSARQIMAKLLRNYSAKMNITVGEILYNARELKRVMERDNLLSSAVARVASLQAGGDQQGAKARRDELFAMLDEVMAKANAAEKTELPSISKVGLTALEQDVAAKAGDAEDRDYLVRVAISRELIAERSFMGKLENVIGWADGVDPAQQVGALDDFIADTLSDPTVIQDVLGRRDNLLAAVLAMLDLLEGQLTLAEAEKKAEGGAVGERLNKLIAGARLPGAVAVISDRVQSMIASRNPLVRDSGPEDEKAAFRKLAERLIPIDGPLRTSPDLLQALIERGARVVNKGGDTGRNEAAAYILDLLVEHARKVRFIFAWAAASANTPLAAYIPELIKKWTAAVPAAQAFNPETKNPALVMRAATNLFYQIRDSKQSDALTKPLMDHIEGLLFDYIEKAQILKLVDDPTRPLLQRARLLMSMCLPDMLPPGKAVEAARVRVVNYLRQPDFTTQVVAHLPDPKEKETALRELFELMRRAGFKMG